MSPTDSISAEIEQLRSALDGDVAVAGDDGWDEARQAWNLAVDQRPALVVRAANADDAVVAVRFAAQNGLRVAVQGTGHGATALQSADTLLLKLDRMTGIEIDPAKRSARVEAGALWGDVVGQAAAHGLAPLSGSSPDVGVAGYTLGGGLSWLARSQGLACNHVHSFELVTADGELVTASASEHPDLFWALRGGGGSFGAVTALEFELLELPALYAGNLFFPIERAAEVLPVWREWCDTVPEEVTSLGRLLNVPPLEEIPEMVRGRSFALIEIAYAGDEANGAELVAPLRELGAEIDTIAMIPPPALAGLHMDPPGPVPGAGNGLMLKGCPVEAIEGVIAAAGHESGSALLSVELRHLGGALKRTEPESGALASLDGDFLMFAVGMAPDPDSKAKVESDIDAVVAALASWDAGADYLNFVERPSDCSRFFSTESFERLGQIKHSYDPQDLFCANHPIAPTA